MSRKVVYIAGPMRGYDNFNFPAFYEAEHWLKQAGFITLNPARNGNKTLHGHLFKDAESVVSCDLVAVLPGWEDSEGAQLEVLMANYLGTPVYLAESLYPHANIKFVRVVSDPPRVTNKSLVADPDGPVDAREHDLVNTSRCEWAAEEHMANLNTTAPSRAFNTVEADILLKPNPLKVDPLLTPYRAPQKTRFEELLAKMQELHDRKKSDYTGDVADILYNYRASGDLAHIGVVKSIFARLCEKVIRVSSIIRKGGDTKVQDETVMDTCLDLAIISLLLRIAFEEEANVVQKGDAVAAA